MSIRSIFVLFLIASSVQVATSQSFSAVGTYISLDTTCNSNTLGGNGLSLADFNQDGLDDVSLCTGLGQPPLFYKNLGNRLELIEISAVTTDFQHKQITWIDFDNDGDKDLFITADGAPNYMYRNDGTFNFEIVNDSIGLPTDSTRSFGATFGDVNNDGFLDLFVSTYSQPDSSEFYIYNSSTEKYDYIGSSTGIVMANQFTFCTNLFDYDRDGDLDLYVINDKFDYPNQLFQNDGMGNFTDVSVITNSDISINAMNAGIGDFDHDGLFDIYVTNTGESALLQNSIEGTFTDVALDAGVIFNRVGWAGIFLDIDNDSDEDLYVCTISGTVEPNGMFVNDGTGYYTEPLYATGGLGNADNIPSNVAATGDINGDGMMDIICSTKGIGKKVGVWLNNNYGNKNFIKVNLVGTASNKAGIGAIIDVYFSGNKRSFQKFSTAGYLNQNSDLIHIGLDTFSSIDSMVVHWPINGSVDTYSGPNISVNKINTVVEGNSTVMTTDIYPCVSNHHIYYPELPPGDYRGTNFVESGGQLIQNFNYSFGTPGDINLLPLFEVPLGAELQTINIDCD